MALAFSLPESAAGEAMYRGAGPPADGSVDAEAAKQSSSMHHSSAGGCKRPRTLQEAAEAARGLGGCKRPRSSNSENKSEHASAG